MTSNPMLAPKVIENVARQATKPMTISGTINKTIVLLLTVILTSLYTWNLCATGFSDKAMLLTWIGIIAGIIFAIFTSFKPEHSKITAPIYALCEGLVVGSVSYAYGKAYDGIIQNAIGITLLSLLTMLFLYKTRIIQATQKFRSTIIIATVAIMIFYIAGFIGALLGHPMTILNGGPLGIVVSSVICFIAALNFIIDFDSIEKLSNSNAPEYFEWYGGFALLVTLIWLYFEVLRLLAQLNNRD